MGHSPSHSHYLARCIQLAQLGSSRVYPNPRVGAVIVYQDRIIGEGFHAYSGGPHAEVVAVQSVEDKSLLTDSTIYVSLEPCDYHGKTPPCTDLILSCGIPKVVVGCQDPHPRVAGSGLNRLREKGVEVIMAEDPTPFEEVIKVFRTNQLAHRPYIVLKWAESKDGFIASRDDQGNPQQVSITGKASQEFVHKLRAYHHSIMVGKNTAAVDNPKLTTRAYPGRNPIRIVWDKALELDKDLHLFKDDAPTLILTELPQEASSSHSYYTPQQWKDIASLIQGLYQDQRICSILVEGGAQTLQQFIDQGVYDEVYRLIGDKVLEKGVKAPDISPLGPADKQTTLGEDQCFIWRKG